MNYRKNLITGLIGFAMLAAPLAATAMETDTGRNDSRQPQAQTHQAAPESHANRAPARTSAPMHNSAPSNIMRKEAPTTATRAEPREERSTRTARTETKAASVATHRDSREVRGDSHEVRGEASRSNHVASYDHRDRSYEYRDGSYDHRDYRGHDYGGYAVAEPIYVMPRGYAGGACAWARHLRHVYYQDENTGHPAAASDVLVELHRAERNCGGVPYSYGY